MGGKIIEMQDPGTGTLTTAFILKLFYYIVCFIDQITARSVLCLSSEQDGVSSLYVQKTVHNCKTWKQVSTSYLNYCGGTEYLKFNLLLSTQCTSLTQLAS